MAYMYWQLLDCGKHSFCMLWTYSLGTYVTEASEHFQVGKTPASQRRQEWRGKLVCCILSVIPLTNLMFSPALTWMLLDALCSVSFSVGCLVVVRRIAPLSPKQMHTPPTLWTWVGMALTGSLSVQYPGLYMGSGKLLEHPDRMLTFD